MDVSRQNFPREPIQWTFLQLKSNQKSFLQEIQKSSSQSSPSQCFLQSCTQIGSKMLIYGGSDYFGDALRQLFIFDTINYEWSIPGDASAFQEDHPGARYGHTATIIGMHPPRILVYGGMVGRTNTYEFETPDGVDNQHHTSAIERPFMNWRRKGKNVGLGEEADDSVYFLDMAADKWVWSKPLTHGGRASRPMPRAEHSACKTATNEVTIFGGWCNGPSNELWTFNTVNLEWKQHMFPETSSAPPAPRPRYRHTAEVIGNTLFILGGSDDVSDVSDGARHLGLHTLKLQGLQWEHPELRGINPFPRSGHGSGVIGAHSIVIFGGKRSNDVFLNDLIIIDVSTYSSTCVRVVESCLPTPVANCSLSVIGNACYVFGGTDSRGNCYSDVRAIDIGSYLDASDIVVSEGARSDYSFKIIIIGDAAVGKSALLTRFSENMFLQNYQSTIGIDFNTRMIRVERSICKLEIWDTAGQERFSTITASYYRGAQGALLVYDVGLRSSFEHVQAWFDRAKQLGGSELETVLIGNKSDLDVASDAGMSSSGTRQVSTEEGAVLAQKLGIPFVETSALNGTNVEPAFVAMTSAIKRSVDRRGLTGVRDTNLKKAGGVTLAGGERRPRLQDRCGRCP